MGAAVIIDTSDPVEDLSNRGNKLNSSPDLQGFPDRLKTFPGKPFLINLFERTPRFSSAETDIRHTAQIFEAGPCALPF